LRRATRHVTACAARPGTSPPAPPDSARAARAARARPRRPRPPAPRDPARARPRRATRRDLPDSGYPRTVALADQRNRG
ncbi:hypothetical protein ABZ319_40100, partial [Nocardia sp. NPDC005978]|uniref:hypothetical protein n=1 Tax=Nocardia sp. NPDC005978 TaxID=3156725 RepID=UPI0033A98FCD